MKISTLFIHIDKKRDSFVKTTTFLSQPLTWPKNINPSNTTATEVDYMFVFLFIPEIQKKLNLIVNTHITLHLHFAICHSCCFAIVTVTQCWGFICPILHDSCHLEIWGCENNIFGLFWFLSENVPGVYENNNPFGKILGDNKMTDSVLGRALRCSFFPGLLIYHLFQVPAAICHLNGVDRVEKSWCECFLLVCFLFS